MSTEPLSIYILPPDLTAESTRPIRDFWAAALLSGIYKQGHIGAMVHRPDDENEFCAVAVLEYITGNATLAQLENLSMLPSNKSYCITTTPTTNTTILEYHLTPEQVVVENTCFQALSDTVHFTFRDIASLIQRGYLIWSHKYHREYPIIRLLEPSNLLKPAAVNILNFYSIPTR